MRIAAYLVGKPLWWALEQMGVIGEEGSKTHQHTDTGWWGDYVVVSLVERAADAVEEKQRERMSGPGEALYTMQSFRLTFADVLGVDDGVWRDIDAKVLLRFLERDRGAIVTDYDVSEMQSFIIHGTKVCYLDHKICWWSWSLYDNSR